MLSKSVENLTQEISRSRTVYISYPVYPVSQEKMTLSKERRIQFEEGFNAGGFKYAKK